MFRLGEPSMAWLSQHVNMISACLGGRCGLGLAWLGQSDTARLGQCDMFRLVWEVLNCMFCLGEHSMACLGHHVNWLRVWLIGWYGLCLAWLGQCDAARLG